MLTAEQNDSESSQRAPTLTSAGGKTTGNDMIYALCLSHLSIRSD